MAAFAVLQVTLAAFGAVHLVPPAEGCPTVESVDAALERLDGDAWRPALTASWMPGPRGLTLWIVREDPPLMVERHFQPAACETLAEFIAVAIKRAALPLSGVPGTAPSAGAPEDAAEGGAAADSGRAAEDGDAQPGAGEDQPAVPAPGVSGSVPLWPNPHRSEAVPVHAATPETGSDAIPAPVPLERRSPTRGDADLGAAVGAQNPPEPRGWEAVAHAGVVADLADRVLLGASGGVEVWPPRWSIGGTFLVGGTGSASYALGKASLALRRWFLATGLAYRPVRTTHLELGLSVSALLTSITGSAEGLDMAHPIRDLLPGVRGSTWIAAVFAPLELRLEAGARLSAQSQEYGVAVAPQTVRLPAAEAELGVAVGLRTEILP